MLSLIIRIPPQNIIAVEMLIKVKHVEISNLSKVSYEKFSLKKFDNPRTEIRIIIKGIITYNITFKVIVKS